MTSQDMDEMKDSIIGLTGVISTLVTKIDNLVGLHEKVIRWLLTVVCAIALGKGVIEIVNGVIRHDSAIAAMAGK